MAIVRTVLGDVKPEALGRTLTHEHLSMQFDCCYVPPPSGDEEYSTCPWKVENYGWIYQHPYSHLDNLKLNDEAAEEAVIESVRRFKAQGGGCLVENSTFGIHRNNKFVKKLSRELGIHVVNGTGYYVADSQKDDVLKIGVEELCSEMIKEVREGCADDPTVKCGLIGEIGCYYPLKEFEKTSIRAAAAAQTELKCAVSFHPGRHPTSPAETMRIFTEAGGKADKTIMSHLERTITEDGDLAEFANEFGTYCQFDLFGVEMSYYQFNPGSDYPNDTIRIRHIRHLIDEGFEDKILMAHDIHTKHRLERFGGHGYAHILVNTVPRMRLKGITDKHIEKILITNPAEVLSMTI